MKSVLILTTFLWCHPSFTAFVWGAGSYIGGGLLSAYLLGVRPDGVLVWTEDGTWDTSPPGDTPLYVEVGDYEGLIYYAQLRMLRVLADTDGWYSLPSSASDTRPEWLGETESVMVPKAVHSPGRQRHGTVGLYLLERHLLSSDPASTTHEIEYMFQHGQKYRVIQEHKDGAVRPVRVLSIPDAMPALMGAIVSIIGYTIVVAFPTSLISTAGFVLSRRVRQTTSVTEG